jgi:hypothetical protein
MFGSSKAPQAKKLRTYVVTLKDQTKPKYVTAEDGRRGGPQGGWSRDLYFVIGDQLVATFPAESVANVTSIPYVSE